MDEQHGQAGPMQWMDRDAHGSGSQLIVLRRVFACREEKKTQGFLRSPPGVWLPKR